MNIADELYSLRAREHEHAMIMQALASSALVAENRILRSRLAEAIARVVELEKRLKATAEKPVRREAGRADCSTKKLDRAV